MAPKRKELKLQSVWDETLVSPVLTQAKHRTKLWRHLINSFTADSRLKKKSQHLSELPYQEWCFPKVSIDKIQSDFHIYTTTISERSESSRGDTTKLLVRLQDGHQVETVIMRHRGHATVCISSQIGCQMGCKFCATGTMGIIGDLTSGEIIEQLVHANSITRIRNVVFMGMGEPLNNYDNVKRAVSFMIDTKLFALSPRHVTVSTVGVLKNMYRLSDELPAVNLAFSLHAPNQQVRLKIVPAAKAHPLEKLMEAIDYHIQHNNDQFSTAAAATAAAQAKKKSTKAASLKSKDTEEEEANDITTGEEDEVEEGEEEIDLNTRYWKKSNKLTGVMIEYILIKDINDRDEHAYELAQLLYPRREHILLNLIPYNPTEVAEDYFPPDHEQVLNFSKICMSKPYEIHTRIRQEKGQDIAGACGQLALVRAGQQQPDDHSHDHNSGKKKIDEALAMEDIGLTKKTSPSKAVNFTDPIVTSTNEINLNQNSKSHNQNEICRTLFFVNLAIPIILSIASHFTSTH